MSDPRRQRGFALISVLLLTLLYFGLVHLILSEVAARQSEARRFASRTSAEILAENAAELGASAIEGKGTAEWQTEQGRMIATVHSIGPNEWWIEAEGISDAEPETKAVVRVRVRREGPRYRVVETIHGR